MKGLLLLASLFIFSTTAIDIQKLIGYWSLHHIEGVPGKTHADPKMNELLKKGNYKNYMVFNADSTSVVSFYENGRMAQEEKYKFQLSRDGKTLINIPSKGKKVSIQIVSLKQDTLKLMPNPYQVNVFVRVKN